MADAAGQPRERAARRRRAGPSRRLALALLALFGLFRVEPAGATWSIAAVDPATREVGVAGASCILGSEVIAIVLPDRAAAVAQAITNPEALVKLRASLGDRKPAAEAIDEVTSRWFDSFFGAPILNLRQYGAVSLEAPDAPAHFTGGWVASWSGAESAPGVSVQGNSLVGPAVVTRALEAFRADGDGCAPRLADRLIAAVLAGAEAGGDRRCEAELSALSAFLFVAAPDDPAEAPGLALVRNRPGQPAWSLWQEIRNAFRPVPGRRDENPALLLRDAYRDRAAAAGGEPACIPAPGSAID